jgi:arylsulfate sulfotransferase
MRMPNGDWLLFDNGTHRNFDPTPGTYSRAVAFRIDPVRHTVQQVWAYGKERGNETYSSIVSRVEFMPAVNHVRFCPGYQVPTATGAGGKIIEIDYATRQPVFEMSLTTGNGFGFHRADATHLGE